MEQQIFVNSSKFSAPVTTSDSTDTQKHGGAAYLCLVAPKNVCAIS